MLKKLFKKIKKDSRYLEMVRELAIKPCGGFEELKRVLSEKDYSFVDANEFELKVVHCEYINGLGKEVIIVFLECVIEGCGCNKYHMAFISESFDADKKTLLFSKVNTDVIRSLDLSKPFKVVSTAISKKETLEYFDTFECEKMDRWADSFTVGVTVENDGKVTKVVKNVGIKWV